MYRITFVVDPLRTGEQALSQKSVQTLLAALMTLDVDYLTAHPEIPLVEAAPLHKETRAQGIEDWSDIPTCLRLGLAEPRDIACWRAAEQRVRFKKEAWPRILQWPTNPRITFCLDLFQGKKEQPLSHKALCTLLTALTLIDIDYLKAHPETPSIYDGRVRYEEEPPGQEDWQDIPTTLRMGFGDCEDLAAWCAAEFYVRHGIAARPTFSYKIRGNGSYLYHITVKLPDGRMVDPSRQLGMR